MDWAEAGLLPAAVTVPWWSEKKGLVVACQVVCRSVGSSALRVDPKES